MKNTIVWPKLNSFIFKIKMWSIALRKPRTSEKRYIKK